MKINIQYAATGYAVNTVSAALGDVVANQAGKIIKDKTVNTIVHSVLGFGLTLAAQAVPTDPQKNERGQEIKGTKGDSLLRDALLVTGATVSKRGLTEIAPEKIKGFLAPSSAPQIQGMADPFAEDFIELPVEETVISDKVEVQTETVISG